MADQFIWTDYIDVMTSEIQCNIFFVIYLFIDFFLYICRFTNQITTCVIKTAYHPRVMTGVTRIIDLFNDFAPLYAFSSS